MFFNVVLLRNDLYQRMIVNIAHQGFHTEPLMNSFCNDDQESQAPPNCMHHLLLAESSYKMLRLSKFRPMTLQLWPLTIVQATQLHHTSSPFAFSTRKKYQKNSMLLDGVSSIQVKKYIICDKNQKTINANFTKWIFELLFGNLLNKFPVFFRQPLQTKINK